MFFRSMVSFPTVLKLLQFTSCTIRILRNTVVIVQNVPPPHPKCPPSAKSIPPRRVCEVSPSSVLKAHKIYVLGEYVIHYCPFQKLADLSVLKSNWPYSDSDIKEKLVLKQILSLNRVGAH